jgi:hypothetical protein
MRKLIIETFQKTTFAMTLVGALFAMNSQALAVSYDGENRSFTAINNRSEAITRIYATDRDRPDWGINLLGTSVVRPGRGYWTRPTIDRGYCMFDVLAKFSNGSYDVITNVNLCTALALEFDNDGHRVLR